MAARNVPPTAMGNAWLERLWWIIPLVGVPLTFLTLARPGASRGWLLVRIALAGAIGLVIAATLVTGAIDYRDSRNSGTMAGWMMSILLGLALLTLGCGATGIALLLRSRGSGP